MTAETIAKALGGRKAGSGWTARCPAHDDREPSLSIRDADGKVLVHCHAGCDQRDVIAALKERGLWAGKSARLFGNRVAARCRRRDPIRTKRNGAPSRFRFGNPRFPPTARRSTPISPRAV